MNKYSWTLHDGRTARFLLTPHFDNLIQKYQNNKIIESSFLMDCGIIYKLPLILKYCKDQKIDLRENNFLENKKNLESCLSENEVARLKNILKLPKNIPNDIFSKNKELIIYSMPRDSGGRVHFNAIDVPGLINVSLMVLKKEINLAYLKCLNMIKIYNERKF